MKNVDERKAYINGGERSTDIISRQKTIVNEIDYSLPPVSGKAKHKRTSIVQQSAEDPIYMDESFRFKNNAINVNDGVGKALDNVSN
jgi:hypothetical protein